MKCSVPLFFCKFLHYMETPSMKKALIITTVSGFVPQFEMNNVHILQDLGYEVHYASNFHTPVYSSSNNRLKGTGIISHQIDFVRSPYYIVKNLIALRQLIILMKKEHFHLVHCHTPMGGVLGRIAAYKTNTAPVIYTAHGFHFYKGAPIWNWLFFYPVERFLAKWTDCLITINKEDYILGQNLSSKLDNSLYHINGVGINTTAFITNKDKSLIRHKYGIPNDKYIFLSIGELSNRKNHISILKSIRKMDDSNFIYIICGTGKNSALLKQYIKKYHLENTVYLLGYCTNVSELLYISDCFLFPSKQEGLPVSVLEAMASGLPVICSDIRGNNELIIPKHGGFLVHNGNYKKFMEIMLKNPHLKKQFGDFNKKQVQQYDLKIVSSQMKNIYEYFIRKARGNI